MDCVAFIAATRIGHIVEIMAKPIKAGRRSLTVEVEMVAETNVGRERHTRMCGIFHMVAIPEGEHAAHYALPERLPEEIVEATHAATSRTRIGIQT